MAYYSRKMTPREKNYVTIEKKSALQSRLQYRKNFRVYLVGSKFTVVTDHKVLKWLNTMKDHEG